MNPHDIRSKTKTLEKEVHDISELPIWNFDGSSTGQAPGKDSEVGDDVSCSLCLHCSQILPHLPFDAALFLTQVYLKPVKIVPDPFRGGKNILVLCECTLPDKDLTAIPTNTRRAASEIFNTPAVKVICIAVHAVIRGF